MTMWTTVRERWKHWRLGAGLAVKVVVRELLEVLTSGFLGAALPLDVVVRPLNPQHVTHG